MMNFRRLLFPFSWLYILVTDIRNVLYDKRIFKSASFDIPVIAVPKNKMEYVRALYVQSGASVPTVIDIDALTG